MSLLVFATAFAKIPATQVGCPQSVWGYSPDFWFLNVFLFQINNTSVIFASHFLVDSINFYTNSSCERQRAHSPVSHPMAMAVLN